MQIFTSFFFLIFNSIIQSNAEHSESFGNEAFLFYVYNSHASFFLSFNFYCGEILNAGSGLQPVGVLLFKRPAPIKSDSSLRQPFILTSQRTDDVPR